MSQRSRTPEGHSNPKSNTTQGLQFALDYLQELVPSIPTSCFAGPTGFLPALRPGIDIDKVVAELTRTRYLLEDGWSDFGLQNHPAKHEDNAFAMLPKIIGAIIAASGIDVSDVTLAFECNPKGALPLSVRDDNSQPDCIGRVIALGSDLAYGKRKWIEVAVPGEFQTKDADEVQDNARKLIWSMTRIMRDDPTRRFVFGFTIEKWSMRMWFASRSDILTSHSFDINQDPKLFIQFILRVAFAKCFQLGWDDTIKRVPSDDSLVPQYEILVNNKWYRTIRLLSKVGPETLRGRATKVWEVQELDSAGSGLPGTLVLKDCWADVGRAAEGDLLAEIRKQAAEADDRYSTLLGRSLLSTVAYGNVAVHGVEDNTANFIECGQDLSKIPTRTYMVIADQITRSMITGHRPPVETIDIPETEARKHLHCGPKIHRRVVFGEVGQRITQIRSLSEVFLYLGHIVQALTVLHRIRWVHRDISIGNILVVNGHGILSDFEYAEPQPAVEQHNKRVGTVCFMSPEVESGRYLWFADPGLAMPVVDVDEEFCQLTQNASQTTPVAPPKQHSYLVFRNNPLHDLDSVYWVILWLLLCSDFDKNDDSSITDEEWKIRTIQQGSLAARLFHDTLFRRDIMQLEDFFLCHIDQLHLLPKVQKILKDLESFRMMLVSRYRSVEQRLGPQCSTLGFDVADGLHGPIYQILADIRGYLLANGDLHINPRG